MAFWGLEIQTALCMWLISASQCLGLQQERLEWLPVTGMSGSWNYWKHQVQDLGCDGSNLSSIDTVSSLSVSFPLSLILILPLGKSKQTFLCLAN